MKTITKQLILLAFTQLVIPQFFNSLFAQCNPGILKTPEELVKNRLMGDDQIYGHPYTMFNKRNPDFKIEVEVAYIRAQIQYEKSKNPKPVYDVYFKILTEANSPRPADANADATDDYSKLAVWAKYNAFVFVIGLDAQGNPMNTEPYLNNVYAAFEHMNYEGADDKENVAIFANTAIC